MRLSGLASGLDVDSMVKELMKARRTSYDTMIKKKTQVEWQRDDYRNISTKIVDFRYNKLSSYNLSNAINAKTGEISGDKNAIQLNATNSTAAGTLNVNVTQVATAETRVYNFGSGTAAASLQSLGFAADPDNAANVAVTINGEKISLASTATLKDLSTAINAKSTKAKATSLYNETTGQLSIASTVTGANKLSVNVPAISDTKTYTFASGKNLDQLGFEEFASDNTKVTVNVNGSTLVLDKTATLADLADAINADPAMYNAKAEYNNATGKFSIRSLDSNPVALEGEPFDSTTAATTSGVTVSAGKDAQVTINGVAYEQDSNRFVVNGVDFTVKAETTSATSISVVKDTSKIVDTVKSFITEYNNLIGLINGELSEDKNRKYLPLTSDEKAALTEKEVELLETKARSGMLRNDTTLSKFVSDLRVIATSLVGGVDLGNDTYLSVGVSTGSYSEKGKLVLDEEKLRNALDSNPDEVVELFSGSNGIFKKMMDSSTTALKDLNKLAGTSLTSSDSASPFMASSLMGERLRDMESKEAMMLTRLNRMEVQYYKQFTAMETAINKFNSQSSSLSSFL